MSIHVLCPGCVSGRHDRHVGNWNTRPGLIGGSYCGCPGDDEACAQRAHEATQAAMERMGIAPAALAAATPEGTSDE